MAQLMMVGTVGERLAGGSKDFVVVEATDELVRTGKPLAHGEVDLAVAEAGRPVTMAGPTQWSLVGIMLVVI